MAKGIPQLEWCVVRLGEDHNWWVDEVSDPVHWDVDGLSIIDPRQVDHVIELIDPLREYGFDSDLFERAFIPFRIAKDMGKGQVRLQRTKESLLESEDKLFALPDIIDEENGPYADFLNHITRLRVKLLNDLFDFEEKLTVDEVEDQIREQENNDFIEGKAVHLFSEITAILDFMPAGYGDDDEESDRKRGAAEEEESDLPEIEEEEDERMKNDSSLKWDDDEEGKDEDGEKKESDGDEEDGDDDDDDDDGEEKDFDDDDEAEEDDDKPSRSKSRRR
ncbi:MAG TPA: hypothetical protein VFJ90_00055 [Candidatus Didemnitutus sp.]|nr:hypothetical protein [Candidatus Didemnitutus sp.]